MKIKNNIIIAIIAIVSIFISYKVSKMIFNDYMFFIDMCEYGNYKVVNSHNNGVEFDLIKCDNYYNAIIPKDITGQELNLKLYLDEENKKIDKVIYNDCELENSKILKLNDISNYNESYNNIPLFIIKRDSLDYVFFTIIISIIFTCLFSYIVLKEKKECNKENKKLINILTYSNSIFKVIRKKDFLVILLIFIIVSFINVGCDSKVIANVANLFSRDIDIYQMQVNTKMILGTQYAEFPYNSLMLCIWGGIINIFTPIIKILPIINNFPYFEVGIIKMFSLIFIILTISSVLSFLLDHKFINEKKAKFLFYLSIFNPITFYVSFLFVQLDSLTLYLIVTGTLLLKNINSNRFLGIIFLSIGLMLKMQILFLLPIVVIAILYSIFYCSKDNIKDKIIRMLKCLFIFSFISIITFVILYVLKTPFYYLQSNLAQSERLWYTTIQYSGNTFLFISLVCLIMAMLFYMFNLHSKISIENMIISSIIYYAVIIFLFSFAVLPTPSIYVVTLGAFIVIMALEKEQLRNIILFIMSSLVIVCPMFSDYGDISKILSGPNSIGIITEKINSDSVLPADRVRIYSMFFTVSATAMLTYAIYFAKSAINIIKKEEKIK